MTIWKQFDDWKYEYFPIDEPISTFHGAEEFVELWHNKKAERKFPTRADYDWYDLQPWWGSIGISAYSYDPFDYQYSLFGTQMVERFQYDATGKSALEFTQGVFDGGDDLAFYKMIAENGYISRVSGNIYWQDRSHVEATITILLMSDSDVPVTHSIELMI